MCKQILELYSKMDSKWSEINKNKAGKLTKLFCSLEVLTLFLNIQIGIIY